MKKGEERKVQGLRQEQLRNMEYGDYLQSPEWQAIRRQKLIEADYTCNRCASRDNLNVHHKYYGERGCETMAQLEVLCRECHHKHHREANQKANKPRRKPIRKAVHYLGWKYIPVSGEKVSTPTKAEIKAERKARKKANRARNRACKQAQEKERKALEIANREQIRLNCMSYREYLRTPEWRAVRERKLTESGDKCRICKATKKLNVYHFVFGVRGREEMNELEVLCNDCHYKKHYGSTPTAKPGIIL